MNVAAVDIGTNSVRLLITDGRGQELAREMRITRLGQGVDRTGLLDPAAIARTVVVLGEYGAAIRAHGVARIRAAATSAARDAGNSELFFEAAERALGARPEMLAGEEEARLSFAGATAGVDGSLGPFLVIDIGGGSTEFVLGRSSPEALISIDLGCVRMSERHLHGDPPTQQEIDACVADVRLALARVREAIPVQHARTTIGLAGTVTALCSLQRGSLRYDPTQTHHARLTRDQVEVLVARLAAADVASRRPLLAEPKRAEMIVGGGLILRTILREFDLPELIVSESDILDGLAASLR
jgi:exopolyphosphatase / guanosine-5'-triphosphate,3'-diphosphate pyrophosphatase